MSSTSSSSANTRRVRLSSSGPKSVSSTEPPRRVEQAKTVGPLDRAHLHRHRWLGDPEPVCSTGEAAFIFMNLTT